MALSSFNGDFIAMVGSPGVSADGLMAGAAFGFGARVFFATRGTVSGAPWANRRGGGAAREHAEHVRGHAALEARPQAAQEQHHRDVREEVRRAAHGAARGSHGRLQHRAEQRAVREVAPRHLACMFYPLVQRVLRTLWTYILKDYVQREWSFSSYLVPE